MSQPGSGTRNSRRSNTNLHHLSLAPLSTNRLTLDSDDSDQGGELTSGHQSYIAGKSAPTTPGVLSRSSSRVQAQNFQGHGRGSSHSYTHFAFADDGYTGLEKSRSTGVLLAQGLASVKKKQQQQHQARRQAALRLANGPATAAVDGSSEWFLRAGTALTSEARESKGQSWLATRASSTSLVALDDDGSAIYGRRSMDDEHAFASARASRNASRMGSRPGSHVGSRVGSRAPSTRPSRRGSKSDGTRPELGFMTPTRGGASRSDYFGAGAGSSSAAAQYAGPDFVDPDDEFDADEEEEDEELMNRIAAKVEEEEIARLAKDRGFGLGGIFDQLLSSTLFSVREDGEDTEGEDEDAAWEAAVAREGKARRVRGEHDRVRPSIREAVPAMNQGVVQEQGGWRDAAWLLSVATKVMF